MDFDSWVFTIAITLCVIAIVLYEPRPIITCEVYHEGNSFCTTYDGTRMQRRTEVEGEF